MKGCVFRDADHAFLFDLIKGLREDVSGMSTPQYVKTAMIHSLDSVEKSLKTYIETDEEAGDA